jgi:hypothetical protein
MQQGNWFRKTQSQHLNNNEPDILSERIKIFRNAESF